MAGFLNINEKTATKKNSTHDIICPMDPIVTTIIPTFQRPQLLRRAIQSALSQTMSDICIMVIDNCSCDETEEVVAKIQKNERRVLYHRHQKSMTVVENFQYGFAQVKTSFCSILSDDDYLAPTFYQIALAGLNKYQNAQFFVGSVIDVHENGKILNVNALKWKSRDYYNPSCGVSQMIEKYVNWTGTLFRTAVVQKNTLDPEVQAIDLDFMIRMTAQYPFVLSKKTCAYFVQHPSGYSSLCGVKLVWPSFPKIVNNAREVTLPQYWSDAERALHLFLKRTLFGIGCRALNLRLYSDVKIISEIAYSQYGKYQKIKWLEMCTAIFSCIPPLHYLFAIAYQFHRNRFFLRLSLFFAKYFRPTE